MLSIKNLSKKINDKIIINNVSLNVKPGETVVLLGASGVGKSTLLRVLNNLETFNAGTITLNEKPLDLKNVNIQHITGMLSQHFDLFSHLTTQENITLVLEKIVGMSKKAATKKALELLDRYGIKELASRYPGELSGGQKQRLAIARMVALQPKIICFDEPTSALDPALTRFVANNIKKLAEQGYIVLVATHDTMLLEHLPCTIHLMYKGKIAQSASSQDFWHNREKYSEINSFIAGEKSA